MLIEPNTFIRLIKNCPLNNKYEHTIYFESKVQQTDYFKGLDGVPFTKQSYQRYDKGVISVKCSISEIHNCNYMMFCNESFENKWFYAFITKIEYVSNLVCRVYYELDIIQTWFWDCTLLECFVEREHSITDEIGENLIEETIDIGPYVYGEQVHPVSDSGYTMKQLSVVAVFNPNLLSPSQNEEFKEFTYDKNVYSGCYQGVCFFAIPCIEENVGTINSFIAAMDAITSGGFLCAFMMPTMFLPERNSSYNNYNTEITFSVERNTDFGGYIPKNNKLFTYPYTCVNLTSSRDKGNDFAFEYFLNAGNELVSKSASFVATGNLSANTSSIAFPLGYRNILYYLEGAVSISSYPMCTWSASGFVEWLNNNLMKELVSSGGRAISSMVTRPHNLGVGGAVGQGVGLVSNAASSIFDNGAVHGGVEGDVLIGTKGGREFTARIKHITAYYAKIIDDYFNRFGYATNRFKIPNIYSRPFWNYIKTNGCVINGSIPADDMRAICSICDNGITFWKKGAIIGIYDPEIQDNSVKSNVVGGEE